MILILDDDERIAPRVLVGHVPGRGGGAGAAAEPESGSLPQGVQREAAMLADDLTRVVLDRARLGAQVAAQKFLERPLADEADAGAVRLVVHRQSGGVRQLAHLRLAQSADRKQRLARAPPRATPCRK